MNELNTTWKDYLMFNPDYKIFADIAFWIVIGAVQAIVLVIALFTVVSYVVNKIFDSADPVKKLTFKMLPDHITSMKLKYDKSLKTVTAVATAKQGTNSITRTMSVVVPDKKHLDVYATNVQLQLMTNIAKELNIVN